MKNFGGCLLMVAMICCLCFAWASPGLGSDTDLPQFAAEVFSVECAACNPTATDRMLTLRRHDERIVTVIVEYPSGAFVPDKHWPVFHCSRLCSSANGEHLDNRCKQCKQPLTRSLIDGSRYCFNEKCQAYERVLPSSLK